MTVPRRLSLLVLGFVLGLPFSARAFAEAGTPVPNVELRTLAGAKEKLLSPSARANVSIFFRTGHDRSADALRQMAACEKDLLSKPVRWVAVVSSAEPAEEAKAVMARSGARMPVLVDEGDALYQKLDVRIHPMVVVVDAKGSLVATEMYRQLDYCDVVKTRIRVLLGEADQAAMDRALNPEASDLPGQEHPMKTAMRDVNMARRLLDMQSWDLAIEKAQRALQLAPVPEAYSVMGDAYKGQGNCAEAKKAYASALKIDPAEPRAIAGQRACGG